MSKNTNLHTAKKARNDEFYTQLSDIEKEMRYYKDFFKGKVVYCNCDDARESNFFKYFSLNFEFLGLKKLITTGYKVDGKGVVLVYEGDKNGNRRVDNEEIIVNELDGDGDFRSEECIEYLKQADVVVTNPPFSLFRQYVKQLMDYGKKFIIIGNNNALTYKDIFQLIKDNEIWLGINSNKTMEFSMPMSYDKWDRIEGNRKYGKVPAISWFTNIENKKRTEPIDLYKRYSFEDYPKYDNFDAINVDKVADIPMDYDGIMGVPITFLNNYCPSQFTIIGLAADKRDENPLWIKGKETYLDEKHKKFVGMILNGKATYARIIIKKVS